MACTVSVVDQKHISLKWNSEESLEQWRSLFASADADKISSCVGMGDVGFRQDSNAIDGSYVVKLHSERNFTFSDMEKMLDRMHVHKLIDDNAYEQAILALCSGLLSGEKIMFPAENPRFTIGVEGDDIIIRSLCRGIRISEDSLMEPFVTELKHKLANTSNVVFDEEIGKLSVVGVCSMNDFTILVDRCLQKSPGYSKNIIDQMNCLALQKLSKAELRSLMAVAKYPSNHPLSRWKNMAILASEIFGFLSDRGNLAKLSNVHKKILKHAIMGSDEFADAPPIITKGFMRLRNRFRSQIIEYLHI